MASKRKRTESSTGLTFGLASLLYYNQRKADSLMDQGKYADAEPLYREALDGCRRELGDAHALTLIVINNLANSLRKQAEIKLAEAERLTGKEQLDGTAVNALMLLAKEGASSL